jgi:hypothetical protein
MIRALAIVATAMLACTHGSATDRSPRPSSGAPARESAPATKGGPNQQTAVVEPVTVAELTGCFVEALAVAAKHAYWSCGGAIYRSSVKPPAPTRLTIEPVRGPMVIDGANLYFASATGGIMRTTTEGSSPKTILPQAFPTALVVVDGALLMAAPASGVARVTSSSTQPIAASRHTEQIVPYAGRVYFDDAPEPYGSATRMVRAAPLAGGPAVNVAALGYARRFAVGGGYVYAGTSRLAIASGKSESLPFTNCNTFTVDERFVYAFCDGHLYVREHELAEWRIVTGSTSGLAAMDADYLCWEEPPSTTKRTIRCIDRLTLPPH